MINFLAVDFRPSWNQSGAPDFVAVLFGRAEALGEDGRQRSNEPVFFNFQVNIAGSIGN